VVAAQPHHLDDPVTERAKRAKRGPYDERPAVLDDPDSLAREYASNSAAAIAHSLDINPQMVVAALKRHGKSLRSRRGRDHSMACQRCQATGRHTRTINRASADTND
jgi:hypothetical protein